MKQRLELTWIGKGEEDVLEPRILLPATLARRSASTSTRPTIRVRRSSITMTTWSIPFGSR